MRDNENLIICPKCIDEFKNIPHSNAFQYRGFYTMFKAPEDRICPKCKSELYETKISGAEAKVLFKISYDDDFILNMIVLKEKDPIEFQLKLAQFKSIPQQTKQVEEKNIPKCPTCGSTNIKAISAGSRWLSTGLFGLSSSKLGKSMECRNCGYKW